MVCVVFSSVMFSLTMAMIEMLLAPGVQANGSLACGMQLLLALQFDAGGDTMTDAPGHGRRRHETAHCISPRGCP